MQNYNLSVIVGRLTEDVKHIDIGDKQKHTFVLAVNHYSVGKQREYVDFIPIAIWRPLSQRELKYLKKGVLVLVEGRINIRKYENKDVVRWITEVITNRLRILDTKESIKAFKDAEKEQTDLLNEIDDAQSSKNGVDNNGDDLE